MEELEEAQGNTEVATKQHLGAGPVAAGDLEAQRSESGSHGTDVLHQRFNDLMGTLSEWLVTPLQELNTIVQETVKTHHDC
jgi:hypothetical protein